MKFDLSIWFFYYVNVIKFKWIEYVVNLFEESVIFYGIINCLKWKF